MIYLPVEICRLFCRKEFYASVAGIVFILFLSANDGMGNMGDSVLSSVLLSSYDAGFMIAFSLAAIPYAAVFTDELEYNYTRYLVYPRQSEKLCFFENACYFYFFCTGNGNRHYLLLPVLCSQPAVGG